MPGSSGEIITCLRDSTDVLPCVGLASNSQHLKQKTKTKKPLNLMLPKRYECILKPEKVREGGERQTDFMLW